MNIFGLLTGFLMTVIGWLTKKFGISVTLSAFLIAIDLVYIAFILSAVTFIMLFLFNIWAMISNLVDSLAVAPVLAGDALGIPNATLISSFFGLLHESGLAQAFITSGQLFLGILSVYFSIQAYKIITFASKEMISIINTMIALWTR